MSAPSLPFVSAPAAPADRILRIAGLLTALYVAVMLAPMVAYAGASHDAMPLIAHLGVMVLVATLLVSERTGLRPLRDWLPLATGPFLYVELRWLIEGAGRPHADALVQGWERALFPANPSATWAPATPVAWISEALHLAYASYYLLIYVPPAILYLRGRRQEFGSTLLALTLVYGVCFVTYLVLPVDGPRFLIGPAAAPDGPIRDFVLGLLAAGSSRGTAFPSSHVAASVVTSLCALRYQRPVGLVVTLLTLGLALGTVYGGFHYAVDVLAGVIVGLAAWLLSLALCRALSTPGAQSASAA